MDFEQAKQFDLVDYLASLGHHPTKIQKNDYWYRSPLRLENTASFKVNRKLNVWYDHGTGQGGNILDFGTLYHHCTIKDFLQKLGGNFSFHQQSYRKQEAPQSVLRVVTTRELSSLSILRYIKQRRIAEEIARKFCKEAVFELNEKRYTAIGFRNNDGGYELRNQWFKGSSSPKAITSFDHGAKQVAVFEGFFDFLSFQTIHRNQTIEPTNFLILNSAAYFEKSKKIMEKHDQIQLYLDHDNTGKKLTHEALKSHKKYSDQSSLYQGYKDLNEWLQSFGKGQSKSLRPGP